VGAGGPFPVGKARPGRDADHSPPSSAEVKEDYELYLLFHQAPSMACSGTTLPVPQRKHSGSPYRNQWVNIVWENDIFYDEIIRNAQIDAVSYWMLKQVVHIITTVLDKWAKL
jgi:hypothetical protein